MKNFFGEFKKFITRGNVVDMAVGVIVGGAFTAIVNGLSNYVLKPIINWLLALIMGSNSLSNMFTYLKWVEAVDENGVGLGVVDLANSIYIDWGSFINAVITFFIVAFVLFVIVKIINNIRDGNNKLKKSGKELKADYKKMKALGIRIHDRVAVETYFAEKAKKEAEEKAAAEEAAKEKARLDKLANPTTEDLLKEIRDILKER